MKKFLILAVLCSLLLAAATVAAATTVTYYDYLPDGEVDKDNDSILKGKEDLSISIVSAGTLINRLKLGAELGSGTKGDEDISLWSGKIGYRVVDAKATKLDGVIAYLNIDTDKSNLRSVLFGFDFAQYFSTKAFLSGALVYCPNGVYDHDDLGKDKSVPVDMFRLKFHYLFMENFGVTAGYTKLGYNFDSSYGDVDVWLGGYNVGLVYIFR